VTSGGPPQAAGEEEPPDHVLPAPDDEAPELAAAQAGAAAPVSGCGAPARNPVPDGHAIVVRLPPAPAFTVGAINPRWWKAPPVSDPTWRLTFLGLRWIPPLAQRAADDGQKKSLSALVAQAVSFHRQNPDPGDARYGWDEGTALRRLDVLSCLYALTRSSTLVAAMNADVAVLLGPRYYGPPYHGVHNHGLMANLAILRAAELLGQTQWRNKALARMRSEAPLAWTKAGTTWEQSSGYQAVNIDLWNRAADTIVRFLPKDPTVRLIRSLTAKADRVLAWMTEPDGRIVLIGDADEAPGSTRSKWTTRTFRDDQAGLVVGRWAWNDPATSYYTLRYGPPRRAHGQPDRTGVTWSTHGVRVLVNPGRFSYDQTSPYWHYQTAPVSHNVAVPDGRNMDANATVSVIASTIRGPAHSWTVADSLFGIAHERGVIVERDPRRLRVRDSFEGTTAFHQMWHLDPAWRHASTSPGGKRLTFRAGARTLTATTTGRFGRVERGATRPPAGWHFPKQGQRYQACEVAVTAAGSATTTFTVT
jgi:hypothetical protein